MSEAKMIGAGILYTADVYDDGPLAKLPEWPSGEQCRFTIARGEGDDEDFMDLTRDEVRALLPMLQAFADGAP